MLSAHPHGGRWASSTPNAVTEMPCVCFSSNPAAALVPSRYYARAGLGQVGLAETCGQGNVSCE